jgi:hypothetical protein
VSDEILGLNFLAGIVSSYCPIISHGFLYYHMKRKPYAIYYHNLAYYERLKSWNLRTNQVEVRRSTWRRSNYPHIHVVELPLLYRRTQSTHRGAGPITGGPRYRVGVGLGARHGATRHPDHPYSEQGHCTQR